MGTRIGKGAIGAVVGMLPGVILILLAQFVITGELQLTVGAPGIVIAAVGLVVGFALGYQGGRPRS
jgi:hypothetical protein